MPENKAIPYHFDINIFNLEPVNEYISACEIDVFYLGENRNGTYITDEVGKMMSDSLPCVPIVALYNADKGDFEGHGRQLVITDNDVEERILTIPYGVVSETAPRIWKDKVDASGVTHRYLSCKGYLWTGRYPELNKVLAEGKGQSMEIFPESVTGVWAKMNKNHNEVFVYNEAKISALCILGDEHIPCFEGAHIGPQQSTFTLDTSLKADFEQFIYELNEILHNNKGGAIDMDPNVEVVEEQFEQTEVAEEPETQVEPEAAPAVEESTENVELELAELRAEKERLTNELQEALDNIAQFQQSKEETNAQLATLQTDYQSLKEQFDSLSQKALAQETAEKEALFEQFSILGEEVLNPIKNNMNNYSVDELSDKLSACAFKAGLSASSMQNGNDDAIISYTYTADSSSAKSYPAWIEAIRNRREEN